MKDRYKVKKPKPYARKWDRTRHRLTCTPRTLAKEILAELKINSTPIMRYYEQNGYTAVDNGGVKDLIVRTVRAHTIYGPYDKPEEKQDESI